jgi:predicted secreted protein
MSMNRLVGAGLILSVIVSHHVEAAESTTTAPSTKTEIQLVQQAERIVPRDRVLASLRVTAKGPNARQIQLDINRKMTAALAKVKESPSVTAETGSYAVNRPYNAKEGDDWRGAQILTMTSDDFEAVLNLAGELQNDGLVMGELRFFVSPDSLRAAQDELTAAALKALRDRAESVAGDLALKVERYKSINIGNAQEQFGESPVRSKGAVAEATKKAPPPAAIAGEAVVTLTVNSTVLMAP